MSRPADDLRQAIQQLLDSYGDGWPWGSFVLSLGLQRVSPDGELESSPWSTRHRATRLADRRATGAAIDLRHGVDIDD